MKASIQTRYGPPEVLQIKEIEKPVPNDNEVLIKIVATTVNRTDCGFRKPEYPLIIKLMNGFFTPKRKILGSEFAGVVEGVGKNVNEFKIGDEVFGLSTKIFSTHAEYICLPEDSSIEIKPANMSFAEAAAVCDGMMLGFNYIGKIKNPEEKNILIYGASGSIGTAGVQLAKYFKMNVTAVCNTKNMEIVKSLGADEVIDYTKEDFTKSGKMYDVVFDAVGKSSFSKCVNIVKKGGIYFSSDLGFLAQNIFLSLWTAIFGRTPCGRIVLFPVPRIDKKDIKFFKKIIEEGKYKAVIDRSYQFDQIIEAYRYVETEQKTGNVVITI